MAPHHSPRPDQSEIPTDRLEAAADQAMSGPLGVINGKLDQIIERLAKGDTAIALLEHRVSFLEKIVYGLCSVVLLSVLGAIVAIVIRSHP